MKPISLFFILLLAFLLIFSSPSIMARELPGDQKVDGTANRSKNPKLPVIACGGKDSPTYAACINKGKPPKSCIRKGIYGSCKPPQGHE